MSAEKIIETDVLIIGGGIAGCFASIKAKEQGVEVVMVDKGSVGRSGATPFGRGIMVFNPDWGHDLNVCMDRINKVAEYINNREWGEIIFKESYERYQELISWGVEFEKDNNDKLITKSNGPGHSEALNLPYGKLAPLLRKQVENSSVTIVDRVMITDLVRQEEKIVGAVGFSLDNNKLYFFKAKATVICAGTSSFKPFAFPISDLTGDGAAMAYRAGAEITGKEFNFTTRTTAKNPAAWVSRTLSQRVPSSVMHPPRFKNAEGDELPERPGVFFLNMEFETHAGRAPIYSETADGKRTEMLGGAASGASVHMSEGIWPVNTQGATGLLGLYAAGESCGIMLAGSVYPGGGLALSAAGTTGARAGLSAARYAEKTDKPTVDEGEVKRLKLIAQSPLERSGGFSPRWVTQVLQNTVIPYFILFIKHEDRMKSALTIVSFIRDHLVPKLLAKDLHELRLAHETKNMVLNAEMKLKASLFRKESRGTHYREDYTQRDDPDWLAWVLLKNIEGEMKVFKKPVPQEWWPDFSIPYKERYAARFPGEA